MNPMPANESRDGSSSWRQDPPAASYDRSVAIYGEIVSTLGIDSNAVFVCYQVLIPTNGWILRKGNLSDGVAQNSVPHENFQDAEGMLHGTSQTSLQSGSTVYCGVSHSHRLFLGLSFFLYNCMAVIFDVSYPFWIVSLLFLLFLLGTGFPGTNRYKPSSLYMSKLAKLSATQADNNNSLYGSEHIFNHLISLSFDYRRRDLDTPGTLSTKYPTLFLQVYSRGWFGRIQVEGYGFLHLKSDDDSVSCDELIHLWRPIGGLQSNMREFYVGGTQRLKDERFVDVLNEYSRTINKHGISSTSSGSIRFRYHSLVTDPSTIISPTIPTSSIKSTINRRTVEDILQAFRVSADTRKFRTTLLGGSNSRGLLQSMNSSRGNLKETKQDRVAEILARTREKVRESRLSMVTPTRVDAGESGLDNSSLHMDTLLRSEMQSLGRGRRYDDSNDDDDGEDMESATLLKKSK